MSSKQAFPGEGVFSGVWPLALLILAMADHSFASEKWVPRVDFIVSDPDCIATVVNFHTSMSSEGCRLGHIRLKNAGDAAYFVPSFISPDEISYVLPRSDSDGDEASDPIPSFPVKRSHRSSNKSEWNNPSVRGSLYHLLVPGDIVSVDVDIGIPQTPLQTRDIYSIKITATVFIAKSDKKPATY